jgi:hypothetical protein
MNLVRIDGLLYLGDDFPQGIMHFSESKSTGVTVNDNHDGEEEDGCINDKSASPTTRISARDDDMLNGIGEVFEIR